MLFQIYCFRRQTVWHIPTDAVHGAVISLRLPLFMPVCFHPFKIKRTNTHGRRRATSSKLLSYFWYTFLISFSLLGRLQLWAPFIQHAVPTTGDEFVASISRMELRTWIHLSWHLLRRDALLFQIPNKNESHRYGFPCEHRCRSLKESWVIS